MANKNSKQVRAAQRTAMRLANKGQRKTRAQRKLKTKDARSEVTALAQEVGLSIPVYNLMRQEASHEQIKLSLSKVS
jgi:hypothetical protein